ncbi:hypothetical protein ACFZC3_15710 [Streptomyces sp. NPDC007903]|uniref:hypothetical protein n=1 Tax=Streptomyces sp. NPDC007903 TaxID=3364786 RepID=UPI0036E828B5
MTTHQDPEWLGQTVLMTEVSGLSQMSRPQWAGDECLWCASTHDLQPLEPAPDLTTRSCKACWPKRLAKVLTYLEWALHTESCPACPQGRCPDSHPLVKAYTDAHTDAVGTDAVPCLRCHQTVSLAEPLVMPFRWTGPTSYVPYFGFLHAGETCPTVRQRGDVTLRAV